jgi:hypothetical protein
MIVINVKVNSEDDTFANVPGKDKTTFMRDNGVFLVTQFFFFVVEYCNAEAPVLVIREM